MIIQLKSQAEKNLIIVGLRAIELILTHKGEAIAFPVEEFEKVLAYGVDSPVKVDEIQNIAWRLTSDIITCGECDTEFTSPFSSVLCPDCSKNQESKN